MLKKTVEIKKERLDAGTAYWMARLSEQIYKPRAAVILKNLQSEDKGFKRVQPYKKGNMQAAIVEHQKYIVMVFRGTDELKDWRDNTKIDSIKVEDMFEEGSHMQFHEGFYEATKEIWDDANMYTDYKTQFESDEKPLFLTGHSLGGAMATIVAAHLIKNKRPFFGVYTFGQPCVVGKSSIDQFNEKCRSRFYRFSNDNDIIPRLDIPNYDHVGMSVYISQNQEIVQDENRRIKKYYGKFKEIIEKFGKDMIVDHRISHYVQAIKEWNYKTQGV